MGRSRLRASSPAAAVPKVSVVPRDGKCGLAGMCGEGTDLLI